MATRYLDKEFGVNPQTAIADDATGRAKVQNLPNAAGHVYDQVDGFLKYNDAGNIRTLVNTDEAQTLTNKVVVPAFNTYAVDSAISVAPQIAYLTKGSAGAYTLAAPGAAGIGVEIKITSGSAFAHVVTFTGTTLQDGTTGANTTWTAAAFEGSSLTVVGVTATKWNVVNFNLGTIAP